MPLRKCTSFRTYGGGWGFNFYCKDISIWASYSGITVIGDIVIQL